MSVTFSNTAFQGIDFGSLAAVRNLNTFSVSFWIYLDTYTANSIMISLDPAGATDEHWQVDTDTADGKITLWVRWSTSEGEWRLSSGIAATTWKHIVITYNNSSTSNNPSFYVDGSSASITETQTPIGTYRTGTGNTFSVGKTTGGMSFDGRVADVRVYNFVISASQASAIYTDGPFGANFDNGLIFNAPLTNCTALSGASFDGYTLTASQLLIDRIGCAQGTPSGSPLGSTTEPS